MKNITFLALLSIILLVGCKKPENATPNSADRTLSLVTTSAKPGQFVTVKASSEISLTEKSYVMVSGTKARLYPSDSNKVIFILPAVPSGRAVIDFNSVGVAKQLDLTVDNYTVITQPAAVLSNYTTEMDKCITKLQKYSKSPYVKLDSNNIELLKFISNGIKKQFDSLSASEKISAAYFLQSSMPDDTKISDDSLFSLFYGRLQGVQNTDPTENLNHLVAVFLVDAISASSFCGLGFGLLTIPSPDPLSKITALASTGLGVYQASVAISDWYLIARAKGIITDIGEGHVNQRLAANQIKLIAGDTNIVTFRGIFRNPISSDSSSTLLSSAFSLEKKIRLGYNRMIDAYNVIAGWSFGALPPKPYYQNPVNEQPTYSNLPIAGHKLFVTNISRSDVGVYMDRTPIDSNVYIYPSSSYMLRDSAFSFDLVYRDYKSGGGDLHKRINAILTANCKTNTTSTWKIDSVSYSSIRSCIFETEANCIDFETSNGAIALRITGMIKGSLGYYDFGGQSTELLTIHCFYNGREYVNDGNSDSNHCDYTFLSKTGLRSFEIDDYCPVILSSNDGSSISLSGQWTY